MASFVLVANGISSADFEKATEIQVRSEGKISFFPQAVLGHGIRTQGISSTEKQPEAEDLFDGLRFEWDQSGVEFGADLLRALAGQSHKASARGVGQQ